MASLFDVTGGKKKGHWLRNMVVKEISMVDQGASPGADVILAKARNLANTRLRKSIADGSRPHEEQVDPMKWRKQVKKAFRAQVQKMLRDGDPVGLSLVEKAGIALSGSDVDGTDMRDPQEHADDQHAIVAAVLHNPPISSENWTTFAARVFGDDVNGFTSAEMAAAKQAFKICRSHGALREAAGEALEGMAKNLASETGKTFEQSYVAVCKSAAGSVLYKAMKAKLTRPDDETSPAAVFNEEATAARSLAAGPTNRRAVNKRNDTADADQMTPDECNALIQDEARRIQREHGTSATSALTMAAQRYPVHYKKSRNAVGGNAMPTLG